MTLRLGIELAGDGEAYQFSVTILTRYGKRGGLKRQKFIFLQLWRPQI